MSVQAFFKDFLSRRSLSAEEYARLYHLSIFWYKTINKVLDGHTPDKDDAKAIVNLAITLSTTESTNVKFEKIIPTNVRNKCSSSIKNYFTDPDSSKMIWEAWEYVKKPDRQTKKWFTDYSVEYSSKYYKGLNKIAVPVKKPFVLYRATSLPSNLDPSQFTSQSITYFTYSPKVSENYLDFLKGAKKGETAIHQKVIIEKGVKMIPLFICSNSSQFDELVSIGKGVFTFIGKEDEFDVYSFSQS